MKKIILSAAITIFSVATTNAQIAKKAVKKSETTAKADALKVDGAGMAFENETIDYGTIAANSDGKREFVFVNNGNKPLIIESAQGSCGCTVPSFPKEPIAPGAKAVIGVKYDTSRAGQPFTKTITIKSNAAGQETKVVTIKGNVLALPTADGTPASPTKS